MTGLSHSCLFPVIPIPQLVYDKTQAQFLSLPGLLFCSRGSVAQSFFSLDWGGSLKLTAPPPLLPLPTPMSKDTFRLEFKPEEQMKEQMLNETQRREIKDLTTKNNHRKS